MNRRHTTRCGVYFSSPKLEVFNYIRAHTRTHTIASANSIHYQATFTLCFQCGKWRHCLSFDGGFCLQLTTRIKLEFDVQQLFYFYNCLSSSSLWSARSLLSVCVSKRALDNPIKLFYKCANNNYGSQMCSECEMYVTFSSISTSHKIEYVFMMKKKISHSTDSYY